MKRLLCAMVAACAACGFAEDLAPELEAAFEAGFIFNITLDGPDAEALEGKDYAAVVEQAEAGNPIAALQVAEACLFGNHVVYVGGDEGWDSARETKVPVDLKKAFTTFQSSARKGNGEAQVIVGQMHYFGLGTATNDVEAVKWFTKAAEGKEPVAGAKYWLGRCHDEGRGVAKRDFNRALAFMKEEREREDRACCGYVSEWVWAHAREKDEVAELILWPRSDFPPWSETLRNYTPRTCTEAVVPCGTDEGPQPKFLAGARGAVLLRTGPGDTARTASLTELLAPFKLTENGSPVLRWAALTIDDFAFDPEAPDPASNRCDIAVALLPEGEPLAFTNSCYRAFTEQGLSGWDVVNADLRKIPSVAEPLMDVPSFRPCCTRTFKGVVIFASNHRTLRKMADLYNDASQPGGFPELVQDRTLAFAASFPAIGKLLEECFREQMDGSLLFEDFFANGPVVICAIKTLRLDARLTTGGQVKVSLALEVENEADARRLRNPLAYFIPQIAASAQKAEKESPLKDAEDQGFLANLRLSGEGKAIKLETFFKADCLKHLLK